MKRARGDDQSDGQVEQQNKKRMHQAHVSHEADIPKIELERQERIAKNKAMMEQLQLQEHAARLQHLSKVRGLAPTMATTVYACSFTDSLPTW